MGLFDKKYCDVCSEKVGLLGNRKLEDGNMCSKCAKKLSPFTTDRRRTTLREIKEHLAYREANKAEVAAFRVTRSIGGRTKLLIDDGAGKFIVTSSDRWQNENPDVIKLSQISDCRTSVEESRTEIMRKDNNGRMVSQYPRQYKVELDYKVTINVNSPYFSEIEYKLNFAKVDSTSRECRDFEYQLDEIKQALRDVRPAAQNMAAQPMAYQNAPPSGAAQYVPMSGAAQTAPYQNAPLPGAAQNAPPPGAAQPAAYQNAPTPGAAQYAPMPGAAQTALYQNAPLPGTAQYAPQPGAAQPTAYQNAPPSAPTPLPTAPTGQRVCPSCGATAASGAGKFCEFCGGAMQ